MTATQIQQQNKQLHDAIVDAVRSLQAEGKRPYISAPTVRSIVYDIGLTARQTIPETFQLYLPSQQAQFMSPDDLSTLLSHLRDVARVL